MGFLDTLASLLGNTKRDDKVGKLMRYAWEEKQMREAAEEKCSEKDDLILELASDILRRGGSLGGKILADRKKYLNSDDENEED